jgi:hypothetical protein
MGRDAVPYDAMTVRTIVLVAALGASVAACRWSTLPAAIGDREFWALVESLSEPAGTFAISDNFVSNEPRFAENARFVRARGGAYIGVGPEQNFSYIATIRPATAFVVDIRRENRNLHLLYKVLFEISADRADFVSRLFSRPRPPGLDTGSSAAELFDRYAAVAASSQTRDTTIAIVRERLLEAHHFPLTPEDLAFIDRALAAFYTEGPEIQFWTAGAVKTDTPGPTYRRLMTMPDLTGVQRSFLADEGAFRFVKRMQSNNLIVPVVGDFGGPSTIRRVGDYVRSRGATVSAFYASNVGVYLTNRQTRAFCASLSTLPVASGTAFIESNAVRTFGSKLRACENTPASPPQFKQ